MKILLTSDWHLEKKLYEKNLLAEQGKFFTDTFLKLLQDIKPDLLVMAGDIFDRPNPNLDALDLYEEILQQIYDLKVKGIFILGNHDSRRASLHSKILNKVHLYLVGDLNLFINPMPLQAKDGTTYYVYALPYLSLREYEEEMEVNEEIESISAFFSKLLLSIKENLKKPALLISHLAIYGTIFCEEEQMLKGFTRDFVLPRHYFSEFSYVLLGHLHRQQTHHEKFFYPGAPLPYSFEERSQRKGVLLLEFLKKGGLHQEFIPLPSPYELKTYYDYLENLEKLSVDEAYVKVILKNQDYVLDAERRLKRIFPNLLSLNYEKDEKIGKESLIMGELRWTKSDPEEGSFSSTFEIKEVFSKFYTFVKGEEPSEELKKQFEKYYNEYLKEVTAYEN